ncbi:hypothetical protein [Flectobacillus sp. BAB-3569]|uniref:hypothetical protein n=1 Tax=Flectobacillus sp. BAB-3569 TaxID=1509483 RepID=UPI000BA2EEEF|nr:hypothetical protein [Flectobacillus sp. BAB-3569]PAC26312.1 hypothetical protein BWI92_26205 [Flectobacillus sp. BAB-3569]
MSIEKKLGMLPIPTKVKTEKSFIAKEQYRSRDSSERINALIPAELKDKMERQAYYAGVTLTDVLVHVLDQYYQDKDFSAKPTGML